MLTSKIAVNIDSVRYLKLQLYGDDVPFIIAVKSQILRLNYASPDTQYKLQKAITKAHPNAWAGTALLA